MSDRRFNRWLGVFFAALTLLASARSDADVINWQTGETIPGTEGIVPGPGVGLGGRELAFADFAGLDLTSARFSVSRLENARFTQAILVGARFNGAHLVDTDFTDANILNAIFRDATTHGFTQEQLYSTASYQARDLSGIDFAFNDLSGWNFVGQNLTNADLVGSTIAGADLTDAVVVGARLQNLGGFTKEQLYSTASYKSMDLNSVNLTNNDLSGWNFAGQNLRNAKLVGGTLTNVNLTDAIVQGAELWNTTSRGFTKEQLYSTLSYKMKDLGSIRLSNNELNGWDFSQQSLVNANFWSSTLTDADFSQANLTNANFSISTLMNADLTDAVVRGANFNSTTRSGFTKEQLYSTASYKMKDLGSINLSSNDLNGSDFSQQNLANARFSGATLISADFSRADLSNAHFIAATLTGADFTSAILTGAKLRLVDLRSVSVTDEQLVDADTRHTIMPDGTIHVFEFLDRLVVRDHDVPVTIEKPMLWTIDATLQVIVSDPDWTSTIHFADDVILDLRGTLLLSVDPNANARDLVGVTFQIFDFDGRAATKRFDQIHFDKGTDWDTSNLYTTGEVTLTMVPEPSTLLLTMLGLIGLVSIGRRRKAWQAT